MRPVVVSVMIAAPLDTVWEEAADFPSHVRWMADAERIEFSGDITDGPGTRMSVATRVGPFRMTDELEVTQWQPPRLLGVTHRGLVEGTGQFELTPMAGATRLEWSERLSFPWRWGGPLTAFLARPVLAWVWRRNLLRFRELVQARLSDR